MKLPLSWIKEFVSTDLSPSEIADILTMAGLEVDGIEAVTAPFSNVVIAKVLEVEPHPQADRLQLATVTDGTNTTKLVCGAPNCRAGLVTALARVGAVLQKNEEKPLKIKKGKIRGVESLGMLCSDAELGLSGEADGIIEFPEDSELGKDLSLGLDEHILEISLTPNLNHCSCALGVARELAGFLNTSLSMSTTEIKENTAQIDSLASVKVEEAELCPRYTCRLVQNVKVGPSPKWLQERLEHCGIRSINNVVDVTNLVLMEFGHPLHGFDLDQLSGQRIIVRRATEGESFTTLDEQKRTLSKDMLMICDAEKPVAIAGVMGGANSEVSENTRNVLLESAYFQASSVRRTSKKIRTYHRSF